jgi:arylsulfatase A-like enzyme
MTSLSRRSFLKKVGFSAAVAFSGCRAYSSGLVAKPSSSEKVNFIFILIDDMGWVDAGCFGSTFYETPNIDRLAREGMRFTDAYAACPVCSPTRASIMAGKYPARMATTDWFGAPQPETAKNHRTAHKLLLPASYKEYLPLEEVTLAEAFKDAGYRTFFAGKWHLGREDYHPEKQGFDINIGGYYRGQPPNYFAPYTIPTMEEGPKGEYLTDRLTEESVRFLEANKGKPFLLYLSHYAVHNPQQAKEDYIKKYEAKADSLPAPDGPEFIPEGERMARQIQNQPVYAGMVQSVDDCVGRIMDKVDELGLADNTVIIFMSDNGGLSTSEGSPTSNVPLRAGKGWLYEGGIREPMIVKWPGAAKAGSVCGEAVTSTDFYPTMLEMANLPLRPNQHVDGVSIVPLLKGKSGLGRKGIFWHYPHYGNQGSNPGGAVRAGEYKLIEFYEDNHIELYNLKDDISERNDLSKKMPGKAAELRKMLHDWRKEVEARMPTLNPDREPSDKGRQQKN